MGFSTVWQLLTTGVLWVLTRAVYYHVRGSNDLSTGLLPRAVFSLNLYDCPLAFIPTQGSLKNLFHARVHTYPRLGTTKFPLVNKINYPYVLFLGSSFVYLLEHPLTPASGTLPTEQQHNGYFVSTPFILSTPHCLSLLIAFNTLFLSRFPLFFPSVDTEHL